MRRSTRWAGAGFLLALVAAPFAALADAPFSPGGVDALPPAWAWFWDAFEPAFTFAPPRVVLDAWQLVVALALTMVLAGAWSLARMAEPGWDTQFLHVGLGLLALHAAGVVVESVSLWWTVGEMIGFAFYFPTTFLAPVAASVAGVAALRRRSLPRAAAWVLVAAPAFLALALVLFNQFPGGSAPGLAAPWALAVHLAERARTPKAADALAAS